MEEVSIVEKQDFWNLAFYSTFLLFPFPLAHLLDAIHACQYLSVVSDFAPLPLSRILTTHIEESGILKKRPRLSVLAQLAPEHKQGEYTMKRAPISTPLTVPARRTAGLRSGVMRVFMTIALCLGNAVAAEPIRLENAQIRLGFDELGRIVEMVNLKTGANYLAKQAKPAPPFVLDVYSANQAIYIHDPEEEQTGGFSLADPSPITAEQGDLKHLVPTRAAAPGVMTVDADGGQRLSWSYSLPHAITVTCTVELAATAEVAVFRIAVQNPGTENPLDAMRLYRVKYPMIAGLQLAGQPEHNWLARPYAQGELLPNPSQQNFQRTEMNFIRADKPAIRTNLLTYPGWASMPWQDLYIVDPAKPEEASGLYLASYDPTFQQIDLATVPDPATRTLAFDIRTLAFVEPGWKWESQRFILGIHPGDWHWAADRYRRDAGSWLKPWNGPDWVRDDDGWFGYGGPCWSFSTLPAVLDTARMLGLNYLQLWSQMIENVGADRKRKAFYCFFLPDPKRGGEDALRAGVAEVRKRGGHIGFYSNVWTFDSALPAPLLPLLSKDEIPKDIPIPDWKAEFVHYASVFPDGHYEPGDYTHGYAGMCLGAKGYRDYLSFWIVDRYVRNYGVDAWYLDSCPVTMFNAARICFSLEHGDTHPHGVGRGLIDLVRTLRERSEDKTRMAIASETISDCLMQYNSHALGVEMVAGLTDWPRPEIYTYTFPDHPIYSGSCNNQRGLVNYYADRPANLTRRDAMNRVFLMGFRFDVLGPLDDTFMQYMKDLIALRQQIKGELYRSAFRDTVGLGEVPERVEAKVFRHSSGASMTLTILDRRERKEAFDLTIDLEALNVGKIGKGILHEFRAAPIALPLKPAKSRRLSLHIPERKAEVAAVILQPLTGQSGLR